MLPFLHHRLEGLNRALVRSSETFERYARSEPDLASALEAFLDESIGMFRAQGRSTPENELLALKAELVSAQEGIDPLTSQRVERHRRQLVRATALRVLQQSAARIRSEAEEVGRWLADGRAQLLPIVALAIQKGLASGFADTVDQARLESFWRILLADGEIGAAAAQLAMRLSLFDILLLLEDLISAARGAGGESPAATELKPSSAGLRRGATSA